MPKQRSPDRDKAKEIYMQHKGNILLNEIANQLDLSEGTIRGWKAKDKWDAELNGTLQSDINKNTERSKQNTERSNKNKKKPSIKYHENKVPLKRPNEANTKTNSITRPTNARPGNRNAAGIHRPGAGAPLENQNAFGNAGGHGGPLRNKYALKTGEFESILRDEIVDEKELTIANGDYTKYDLLIEQIDTERVRAYRMMKRITEVENTPGGMIHDGVTKNKGTLTTKFVKRSNDVPTDDESSEESSDGETSGKDMVQTQDNFSHKATPVLKRVMELEDALSRVQARKQAAISQLHRMEIDDERLSIDYAKLELEERNTLADSHHDSELDAWVEAVLEEADNDEKSESSVQN